MITIEQAYEMGAKGAEPTETERLLFEAWMRGHCWKVQGEWDGTTYVHATERNGEVNYHTMHTRQLWAAWRDRAALAEQPEQPQQEPVGEVSGYYERGFTEHKTLYGKLYNQDLPMGAKLYTSPQAQRTWIGLTTADRKEIERQSVYVEGAIRLTEAKLKEKNT